MRGFGLVKRKKKRVRTGRGNRQSSVNRFRAGLARLGPRARPGEIRERGWN